LERNDTNITQCGNISSLFAFKPTGYTCQVTNPEIEK
jgi:hypothetical protein